MLRAGKEELDKDSIKRICNAVEKHLEIIFNNYLETYSSLLSYYSEFLEYAKKGGLFSHLVSEGLPEPDESVDEIDVYDDELEDYELEPVDVLIDMFDTEETAPFVLELFQPSRTSISVLDEEFVAEITLDG